MAKSEHTDPAAKPAREQQRKDPHGIGPTGQASQEKPTGTPVSDRHDAETAPASPKKPRR